MRLMVPPLPAASRPSKMTATRSPACSDPLLQLHELDLQLVELGLVGVGVELARWPVVTVMAGRCRLLRLVGLLALGPVVCHRRPLRRSLRPVWPPPVSTRPPPIIEQWERRWEGSARQRERRHASTARGGAPGARAVVFLMSRASSAESPPVELTTTLEAELASIAEGAEPGRTARIAVRYWGWDGRGGATLEATGREFDGITRERVRQLCERLAAKALARAPARHPHWSAPWWSRHTPCPPPRTTWRAALPTTTWRRAPSTRRACSRRPPSWGWMRPSRCIPSRTCASRCPTRLTPPPTRAPWWPASWTRRALWCAVTAQHASGTSRDRSRHCWRCGWTTSSSPPSSRSQTTSSGWNAAPAGSTCRPSPRTPSYRGSSRSSASPDASWWPTCTPASGVTNACATSPCRSTSWPSCASGCRTYR